MVADMRVCESCGTRSARLHLRPRPPGPQTLVARTGDPRGSLSASTRELMMRCAWRGAVGFRCWLLAGSLREDERMMTRGCERMTRGCERMMRG
eukprot:3098764-Rhodomonas_salina.3